MKAKIARIVADARKAETGSLRLPRARSRPLLGDVEDVHRQGVRGARPAQHRRRGRRARLRLSAALGRVRRLREPGPDRARGHRLLRPEAVDRRRAAGLGSRQRRADGLDRARSTTRSRRAGGRGSWTSSARCRRRSHDCASSDVSVAAEHAVRGPGPRAQPAVGVLRRGVPARLARRRRPRRAGRPRRRGGARVGGSAPSRPRLLDVALADRGGDPLGDPRAARRARRAGRRDARPRGRDLPGRLPQPARGSVPPRRRGRRGARRDDRDRVPPGRPPRPAAAPRRRVRRRRRSR